MQPALTEGGKRTSLSPFMQHVLGRIYHEVSLQHADLVVTRVTPLQRGMLENIVTDAEIEMKTHGKLKPHLYLGLCKEKPEDLEEANVIPYSSLVDLLGILSESLTFGIYRYLRKQDVSAKVAEVAKSFGVETVAERATGRVFMLYEQAADKDRRRSGVHFRGSVLPKELADIFVYGYNGKLKEERMSLLPEKNRGALLAISRIIHGDALSGDGELDRYIGAEKGTVAALIGLAAKCNAALPELYFDMMRIGTHATELSNLLEISQSTAAGRNLKGQIRIDEKEFSSTTARLESEFGLRRRKILLAEYLTKGLMSFNDTFNLAIQEGVSVYELMQKADVMGRAKSLALQDGNYLFIMREEAVKLLDSAGLPRLIRLIPNMAFFDQVVSSQNLNFSLGRK